VYEILSFNGAPRVNHV